MTLRIRVLVLVGRVLARPREIVDGLHNDVHKSITRNVEFMVRFFCRLYYIVPRTVDVSCSTLHSFYLSEFSFTCPRSLLTPFTTTIVPLLSTNIMHTYTLLKITIINLLGFPLRVSSIAVTGGQKTKGSGRDRVDTQH